MQIFYDLQAKTWHGVGTGRRFGDYALDYMKAGLVACATSPFLHFLEPRAHDEPGQAQDDEGAGDGADHGPAHLPGRYK